MKRLMAILFLVVAVPCLAAPYHVFIHVERNPADTTEAAIKDYEARIEKAQSLHRLAGSIRISNRSGLFLGFTQADTLDVPAFRLDAKAIKGIEVRCEEVDTLNLDAREEP